MGFKIGPYSLDPSNKKSAGAFSPGFPAPFPDISLEMAARPSHAFQLPVVIFLTPSEVPARNLRFAIGLRKLPLRSAALRLRRARSCLAEWKKSPSPVLCPKSGLAGTHALDRAWPKRLHQLLVNSLSLDPNVTGPLQHARVIGADLTL